MFTNGKQSTYKLPTKGLQNLWRVSEDEVNEILQELEDYNICEISREGRFVAFTSRRYEKENNLSKVRSEAVSNRKDRKNKSTKDLQKPYKSLQNTENEIENEDKEKGGMGEKTKYSISDFIQDWNSLRKKHLNKPSFLNKLSGYDDQNNFNDLTDSYTRDDFKNAMIGLFKQRKLPNGNTTMQSNPSHFLKFFNSYLTAYHDKNKELYGKQEKQEV